MKKFLAMFVAVVVMLAASVAMAADTKTVNLTATIPSSSSMNVTISKVVGTVFSTATSVAFGSLVLDPTYNIFKTSDGSYYAVDVGVNSNASAWTVTHAVTSMTNGSSTLNNMINVTFMNQASASSGTQLSKVAYSASNGLVINKSQITTGGWIRIYYGLATGSGDATGVVVIPATQPSGSYAGTVTLTLAP